MKADAESNADADKAKMERLKVLNAAESSLYTTERQKDELKDKITKEQSEKLDEAVGSLKAVYDVKDEDRDIDAIKAASDRLNEVWYGISSELYKDGQESKQGNGADVPPDGTA